MYPNQNRVIDFFKKASKNNRLAHAYLIEGPLGVEKKQPAKEVAKFFNCKGESPPCGKCSACERIEKEVYPDLTIVSPLGPLRIIKIDQIREVKKNVHYKPFEGVKKVCIITEADAMNIEASNALLKVLEEPPAHTVLFLTTSRREKLLPTIISRCQSINIFPLSLKEAEEILIKDFSLAKKEARLLSVLSLGKVNKALEMKEKDFLAKRDRVIEVLISNSDNDLLKLFSDVEDIVTELEESKEHTKEKLKKDLKEYMKEFREELTSHQKKILEERNKAIILSEYKKEVEEFLNIVLLWFRDVLMFKADEEVAFSFIVNIDKEEEIKTFAKKIKYEVLLKNIEIIGKIKRALEGNANLKLAFEVLFLKLGMNT